MVINSHRRRRSGGTYNLTIGSDQGTEYFVGDIAEARLWYGARGGESARRDMHHALNEKRNGLIANWHLTGDFKDSINATMARRRIAAFVGFPSPANRSLHNRSLLQHPAASHLRGRHRLRAEVESRHPRGGYRAGVPSTAITSVDVGSGAATNIAICRRPAPIRRGVCCSNDTVYVFGGSDH